MATVGQQLTSPEAGYRRYNDTDSRILYSGSWNTNTESNTYSASQHYTSTYGSPIQFKFYGTKLRIIDAFNINRDNIIINIDGIDYSYNTNGTLAYQILVFEKIELTLGIHSVTIIKGTNNTAMLSLDAIDIDEDGYLLHPILNQVSSEAEAQVGDCIPIRYTVLTSGQVGYFSEFGTCTANEIPVTGPTTPDGLAYLIMVGYDYMGMKMFIPDRNLQTGISWNALNNAGLVTGKIIETDNKEAEIRLLTGGISSSDTENEWDQIIVNSDLNGTITAGDNNIWHWKGITSWTSTTNTTGNTYRTVRGSTSVSNSAYLVSSSTAGFRPVLLVESDGGSNKFLIKQGNNYYSLKSEFYINNQLVPITLINGESPNDDDFKNNGFDDINDLIKKINTEENNKPIDQFGEIKRTSVSFTTTDNKIFIVDPLTNVPFKQNSVICYKDGIEAIPDEINYDEGIVVFNTEQIGIMTFDYTYIVPFDILLYKPNN